MLHHHHPTIGNLLLPPSMTQENLNNQITNVRPWYHPSKTIYDIQWRQYPSFFTHSHIFTYWHYFLAMYNTQNISHFQATLSSTKSHYGAPCWLSILLDETSLVLLSYVVVHHPNYLTNYHELITKGKKAYWLTMKLSKYV